MKTAVTRDLAQIRVQIEEFLKNAREPALLEPGEELLPLSGENYSLEMRGSRLTLQAWDRTRNWSRRHRSGLVPLAPSLALRPVFSHSLRYLAPLLWAHELTAPPRSDDGHRKRIYPKLFERGDHSIEPRLLLVEFSDCLAQIHVRRLAIQLPRTGRFFHRRKSHIASESTTLRRRHVTTGK